jgi:hypothetical protein
VVERGRTTCTYFCQNGFICDLANKKCLPGPERLREAQKMLDEANRIKKDLNGEKAKERNAKEAQMFGNQRGEYYYKWDGNPKEIPTPRYRPQYNFGYVKGSPSQSTPVRRAFSSAPSRFAVRSYLATLLTSARRLPAGDPSRASIIAAARALIASNNIPFDVDAFLCQSAALPANSGLPAVSVEWKVADIEQEVLDRGLCKDAGDDKSQCVAQKFGLVVLDVEPEIRARCKAQEQDPQEQNIDALAACADRMLRNAWSQSPPPAAPSRASAEQCQPPAASVPRRDSADDLRRRLRAALAAAGEGDEAPEADTTIPSAEAAAPESAQAAAPPAADPDTDEAFCAYIARKSVRGELTPGDGVPIPEYCKKAFDTAKSCTEQSCSMADVIAEEERRQKSNALPWGAADRESIAALQKPLLGDRAPNAPPPTVNAPSPAAPAPRVSAPTPATPSPAATAPSTPSAPTPSPTVNAPTPSSPGPTVNASRPTVPAPSVNAPRPTVPGPTVNTR